MEAKLTKIQLAKAVVAMHGLSWKPEFDGSNGSTVTAATWRAIYEKMKKDEDKNLTTEP